MAGRRELRAGRGAVEVSLQGGGSGRKTVDFLLTARRDLAAARRFFERAIDLHGEPESITIDKSGATQPPCAA